MNHYPEHVSLAAHQVLREYADVTLRLDPEAIRQKGERIASTLHLFVSDRLPDPAYDIAALLPLIRVMHTPDTTQQRPAAAFAVADYLTSPANREQISLEHLSYIEDVAGDFKIIDAAVYEYQEQIAAKDTAFGAQVLRAITVEDDFPIPAHFWTEARAGVNVPSMSKVIHEVNVESIVIGAAALLDDIVYGQDPREQLHNLMVAETFYCPALDALGMWAMDSAMRNAVNRVRLTNAGQTDLIANAHAMLAPIKAIGQERVLEAVFDSPISDATTRFHLDNETEYGSTIHFIDTNITPVGLTTDVRIISRIKGVESVAMKMHEKPDYKDVVPSDIIGLTAVVKGEAQMAELFNLIVDRIESLDNCRFVTAGSKKEPVFVKGGEEFKQSLREKFSPAVLAMADFDEKSDKNKKPVTDFQVAKMTFMMTVDDVDIPIEFQFQTEIDRERAETGDSPHFIQKTLGVSKQMPENVLGEPDDLVHIRNRKRTLLALHRNVIAFGNNGSRFEDELYQWLA